MADIEIAKVAEITDIGLNRQIDEIITKFRQLSVAVQTLQGG